MGKGVLVLWLAADAELRCPLGLVEISDRHD